MHDLARGARQLKAAHFVHHLRQGLQYKSEWDRRTRWYQKGQRKLSFYEQRHCAQTHKFSSLCLPTIPTPNTGRRATVAENNSPP